MVFRERHQPSGVENGEIVDEIDAEAQAAKQHAMK